MRRWKNKLLVFLFLAMLGVQSAWAQCAMCRGGLESAVSGGNTTVAAKLNIGIMYLFFTPYLVLGVLAFFWYRASKRNARKIKGTSHFAG